MSTVKIEKRMTKDSAVIEELGNIMNCKFLASKTKEKDMQDTKPLIMHGNET